MGRQRHRLGRALLCSFSQKVLTSSLSFRSGILGARNALLLLASLVMGCTNSPPSVPTEEPAATPWFKDITDEVGVHFIHDTGATGKYFMPEIMGSGVALFDYDGDGRLDIYLVQNGGPKSHSTNRLFHQGPDGHFTDVSAGSGLDVACWGMGVAIGDVNNDGRPDVLLTEYEGIRLFLNNGNGTFTDVTPKAGLYNPLWATSAAFVDYDRDGWLDLVVVNYVAYDPSLVCEGPANYCHPNHFSGLATKLYHNLGPGKGSPVRFEAVTQSSGLGQVTGRGLGVVCADFDGDHWPDIFVANDGNPNHLWINQHNGTFKEEAIRRGVAFDGLGQSRAYMGVALGDVDGDGLLDLVSTHLTHDCHTLWHQGPERGMFQDQTAAAGLSNQQWTGTGFGTVMADFDHDGSLDLAVVNGRVNAGWPVQGAGLDKFWARFADRNQLFANDGSGHFHDISPENGSLCGTPGVYRGLACGDLDGDGALDLVVTTTSGPALVFRNVAPKKGHWLMVRALDPALHRDAYGAEVTVEAGQRRWLQLVNPGYSFLSSNDPRAHFGLGSASQVDRIHILWPDGVEEDFPGGSADRVLVLRKGEGRPGKR